MSNEKLTRQQRRFRDRINEQVSEVSQYLGDAFLHYFTLHPNPEGPEVAEKMEQIDRQWRVFCSQKRLTPQAYPHMMEYMKSVVDSYHRMKSKTVEGVPNE